jgi:hypothetical protein
MLKPRYSRSRYWGANAALLLLTGDELESGRRGRRKYFARFSRRRVIHGSAQVLARNCDIFSRRIFGAREYTPDRRQAASAMASLADELLNDFEDSGSENGAQNGFMDDDAEQPGDLEIQRDHDDMDQRPSMELDEDEEEPEDAEEILATNGNKDEVMDDEE